MTPCEQVTLQLADGGGALPDSLARHAQQCAECKRLCELDAQFAHSPTVALEPSAALVATLAADHSPVRPVRRLSRAAMTLAVTMALAAFLWVLKPREDLPYQHPLIFWPTALLWVLATCAGLGLLFARGKFGLGIGPRWAWLYLGLTVACFEAVSWMTNPIERYSIAHVGWHAWAAHWVCAAIGLVIATAVGALVFATARRTAAVSPTTAGAVAGVSAGFAGVLALHMYCGFPDPLHLGVVHLVPVALSAIAGCALGRRLLAP